MPHNVLDLAVQPRKQSQHSIFAKSLLMNTIQQAAVNAKQSATGKQVEPPNLNHEVQAPDAPVSAPKLFPPLDGIHQHNATKAELKPRARFEHEGSSKDGIGNALSDTPAPSLPASPRM